MSVTAGVVEPRYPSFKGIMAAKSKPVEELSLADLGIETNTVGLGGRTPRNSFYRARSRTRSW
ncbi:MAG: hypothetical protein CM15mP49_31680 [Actinomycetota bacterium]|nr:MAG: hypothetical protein CM15mP49_31680 [Actinomycetota bacterium]